MFSIIGANQIYFLFLRNSISILSYHFQYHRKIFNRTKIFIWWNAWFSLVRRIFSATMNIFVAKMIFMKTFQGSILIRHGGMWCSMVAGTLIHREILIMKSAALLALIGSFCINFIWALAGHRHKRMKQSLRAKNKERVSRIAKGSYISWCFSIANFIRSGYTTKFV
jgi:hypothetical protein